MRLLHACGTSAALVAGGFVQVLFPFKSALQTLRSVEVRYPINGRGNGQVYVISKRDT